MAKIVKVYRVHCEIRHIDATAIEWSDGKTTIRCTYRKYCKTCPLESGNA